MIKVITYKKQGNGSDSWHVDIHDCETEAQATRENKVSREIVFTDPTKPEVVPMNNFDLSTMTEEQLTELKNILGL
jgi:hypothetical protein